MACVLLSCLTALQTPALAISIYNTFVQTSVSTPGLLPSGTSISFSPGSSSTFQSFSGNALATAAASVSPPGSATALASGFASGPGFSSAFSSSFATSKASIVNQNAATVAFPLTFSHSRSASTSTILGGQSEFVSSYAYFYVYLDSNLLLYNYSVPCSSFVSASGNCNSFDSGSNAFLVGLTPGSHSLELNVTATGSASSSPPFNPTPEPASLLLFGTTMAGLGLARWRQQRRKQEEPKHKETTELRARRSRL
jgi:hypothetical protein